MFVIARNSAFTYKGKAVDVQQVASELGVRYVLEGSVRKAGDRVRITAQLIDAEAATHLWTDSYDGNLSDIFDLQDRITEQVVGALQPTILSAEIERARRKRPDSLHAHDLVLRSLPHVWSLAEADIEIALATLNEALALDSGYAMAMALASWCHGQRVVYQWSANPTMDRDQAVRLAEAAQRLSPDDPLVLTVLATARSIVGDLRGADALLDRALALDMNSAWAWLRRGWVHTYLRDTDTAIIAFKRAMRLSPFDPLNHICNFGRGCAYFVAGADEDAITWIEKGLREQPRSTFMLRQLVPALWYSGRRAEARVAAGRLMQAYPGITTMQVRAALPYDRAAMDRM